MTMTKTGASAPSGSQTTTTFQLGTYNAVTDTFTQMLDLNDQATYFLKPGTKQTSNPKLEQKSTAVRADNVRTHGSNIVKDHLDNIIVTAMFSIKSTTEQGVTDAWNAVVKLVKGQQGSNGGTLCLRFCWPKGTAYSYLDIQYAAVQAPPGNPLEVLAKAQTGIGLILEGGYAWRGDWLAYQNLAWNPGFEQPSGPAVPVFSDAFSNVNAYAVQAGSAPTTAPANTYVDVVYANCAPIRYYRLGLADDASHAYDIGGYAQTGTLHNAPTQGVAGLVSGDTDSCYTFAAPSSQWVDCTTGSELPTGNTAMTLFCLFKISAAPGSTQYLMSYGASGGATNHKNVLLGINSSGKLVASNGSTVITGTTTITNNVTNLAAVSWDGTTMTLSLNGGSEGTSTPGAQTTGSNPGFNLAVLVGAGSFFSGQLDECVLASGAVGLAALTNIYNAAHSGASGNTSNTMSVAAASRLKFGSPEWGNVNTWQVRFRYATSQVSNFYLHYTDANNYLLAQIQSGANGFTLQHDVASSVTTVAQATVPLQHEAWYWLQVTQFPYITGHAPYVQAVLSYDSNGTVGTAISTLAGYAASSTVALLGAPQMAPTGAALVIGGTSSGSGNTVKLFGPSAWQFTPLQGSATGVSSGAWEQDITKTYPSGPQASAASARIDLSPAGTVDCQWYLYNGTSSTLAPTGQWVLPVASTPATFQAQVQVKTSGLGVACVTRLDLYEYDINGAFLRSTQVASLTGNSTGGTWQKLSGSVTTGSNTFFAGFTLRVVDTNAGASANGIVWFDNVLVWDQTFTGTQNMAYCELRFPHSPCQPFVSGLQGTTAAPAWTGFGFYAPTAPAPGTWTFTLGRRLNTNSSAVLTAGSATHDGGGGACVMVLDSTAYGGCYASNPSTGTSGAQYVADTPIAETAALLNGTYHVLTRLRTSQSSGNLSNLSVQMELEQCSVANASSRVTYNDFYSAITTKPLSASATWQAVDLGKLAFPPAGTGLLTDLTFAVNWLHLYWQDTTGGGSTSLTNWYALIPVDGGVLSGQFYNPAGVAFGARTWVAGYMDGTQQTVGIGVDVPVTPGATSVVWPLFTPGHSVGGVGAANSTVIGPFGNTNISFNPGADPWLTLDPIADITNGVNQMAAYVAGPTGDVLSFACDLRYSPYWLNPR